MSVPGEDGEVWIMESPDNGKTITKRKQSTDDKLVLDNSTGEWFPIKEAASILSREKKERKIRAENPAVQEAWEHYRLLLNMARTQDETKQI